jgi:hypothetical protein
MAEALNLPLRQYYRGDFQMGSISFCIAIKRKSGQSQKSMWKSSTFPR